MHEEIEQLAACSRRYGADHQFVFLGGGNTSYKNRTTMFVKPSGISLSTIESGDFIQVDRQSLRKVFSEPLPEASGARETAIKKLMAAAVNPPGRGRASVEAPLHELLPYDYVVHTHPVLVNGMTCGIEGASRCAEIFPEGLWVDYSDPGFSLALAVKSKLAEISASGKPVPQLLFLQNHGVFVAADTIAEIDRLYEDIVKRLNQFYMAAGIYRQLPTRPADLASALELAPRLRGICRALEAGTAVFTGEQFAVAEGPITPDHVAYSRSFPYRDEAELAPLQAWLKAHGYPPRVLAFANTAVFTVGKNLQDAQNIQIVARNAAQVCHLAQAFGGVRYLTQREYRFIEGWEAESYRSQVATGNRQPEGRGRITDLVCLVTGAAQGFGLGIARGLAEAGAIVGLADRNLAGAQVAAAGLTEQFGPDRAFALAVDVADEASVAAMLEKMTLLYGGLDLLVANAGVLRAAPVKELSASDWELVTKVNYTGYFLCVKHTARVMARQNQAAEGKIWSDIVQINSKSGLEGSGRNAAYAGSKFGGVGLTQSFAKELVEDYIKVNSVCPGNYFEGPLWSDPEQGLFVQYLRAGKVPGAKTIEEVKAFYESKVPMGRGCRPEDVVKAILYLIEQTYETGQALPVGGGQVMLS